MDLGLYRRVPRGEIKVGDIVEFPVPPRGQDFAREHCITGPLLKRVTATHGKILVVHGDHMPDRSFDSDVYGPIPDALVTGKYVPLWTWPPKEDRRTFKGGCNE